MRLTDSMTRRRRFVRQRPAGFARGVALNGLGDLAGKRVQAALAAQAADVQAAIEKASAPTATEEEVRRAEQLIKNYDEQMVNFAAAERKKGKTLFARLKKAHEKNIKILGKVDPISKKHAQSIERRKTAERLNFRLMQLQGKAPSEERDQEMRSIVVQLKDIAAKEKKYIKQGKIAATIATIVIGVFTFGGGGAVVNGAFQAIKQGAIDIGKKLLLSAVAAAAAKGMPTGQVQQATGAVNAIGNYPPDPSLPSLDAMVQDSLAKKEAAKDQAVETVSKFAVPVGLITAALLSLL